MVIPLLVIPWTRRLPVRVSSAIAKALIYGVAVAL
jgi:hypothetical protein